MSALLPAAVVVAVVVLLGVVLAGVALLVLMFGTAALLLGITMWMPVEDTADGAVMAGGGSRG